MSHVLYLSIHLPCPAEMKLLVFESLQKKNPISFSQVGSWLLLIPVLQFISQAHCLHLISYSHQPLVLLETSPVDHDPQSILRGDILTLLMVLRTLYKKIPPFLFKWVCLCRKPLCGSMHKSQQSLPSCMCVKHCVVEGLHSVFFFFFYFLPCQPCGTHSENRSLHSGWWQEPQCPAFSSEAAGIHRDKPDGRYLGQ